MEIKSNYYLNRYMEANPYFFEMLTQTDSKAEKKSYKERIIEDIKYQEYPKGQTRLIVAYIKTL